MQAVKMNTSLPTEKDIASFVQDSILILNDYSRQTFDLSESWAPAVELDFENYRGRSYGGVDSRGNPSMKLFVGVFAKFPTNGFVEYKSFAKHKRIGNVRTCDWRIHIMSLMCHEYSHAVQYSLEGKRNRLSEQASNQFTGLGSWQGGHKDFFKNIYVKFRDRFINQQVDKGNLGVPVDVISIPIEHELLGKFYRSAKFGKLEIVSYIPQNRTWKFIVQCPITETRYKTTEERIRANLIE